MSEDDSEQDVQLSVSDHLTNAEAIDFWRRYFSEYQRDEKVSIEAFCESIQAEFMTLVFKPILDE